MDQIDLLENYSCRVGMFVTTQLCAIKWSKNAMEHERYSYYYNHVQISPIWALNNTLVFEMPLNKPNIGVFLIQFLYQTTFLNCF